MRFAYGWVGFDSYSNTDQIQQALADNSASLSATIRHLESQYTLSAGGLDTSSTTRDGKVVVLIGNARMENATDCVDATAILKHYENTGASTLSNLRGAYACIVVDTSARRCFIANDHFGTVPIYYRTLRDGVAFGTRMQSIANLAGAPEIDPQALYNYVFFHCIPSPRTIYRDISKLGPATLLTLDGSKLRQSRTWVPQFNDTQMTPAAIDASGTELRQGFQLAVEDAASGERSGAFLSGGLDSSTVAGMLKVATGEAATFTIGFDEPEYDESGFARTSADHFHTNHHETILAPHHVADALEKITQHLDEPFGNSSVIPTYYCAALASEHGITRLLAGDGGDELFAGNTRYVEQFVFERYQKMPKPFRSLLELGYAIVPFAKKLPIANRGWGYINKAKMGLPDRLQAYNFLQQFDPALVFEPDLRKDMDGEEPWRGWRQRYEEPENATPLQRMLYLDWKFTLADNDLMKVSNMCSLAGIDVRYPMLDSRVVDASLNIDSQSMLLNNDLRGFYKHAWRDFLPPSVFTKSKHGFGLPFGVWMRRDPTLRSLVADTLDSLRQRNIFRTDFIDTALRMHNTESPGYFGELVWIMLVLELWLSNHR